MSQRRLLDFFAARRDRGAPLVLATVYDTRGSTYSKAGARMLIDGDGLFQGMLSGGCLEGDLAVRAAAVLDSGQALTVTYDLAQDDELWGLGVGCDGLMRVVLQPLTAASGYEPFATIAAALEGAGSVLVSTVIESNDCPPGATVVHVEQPVVTPALDADVLEAIGASGKTVLSAGVSGTVDVPVGDNAMQVLHDIVRPSARLLVMGAGLDAEPLVRFADELGWRTTVVDHREAYVQSGSFGDADVHCVPAAMLADTLDLDSFDLAIVMSHHLASDSVYLRQLAAAAIPYIGLLGPAARRERLLGELGDARSALEGRLHGPAGLDLGGRGPAPIALSIVAEMQAALSRRAVSPSGTPGKTRE